MNSAFYSVMRNPWRALLARLSFALVLGSTSVAEARWDGDCHRADWLSKPRGPFDAPINFINCNHDRFDDPPTPPPVPTCQEHCGRMANSATLNAYCDRMKGMTPWLAPVVDSANKRVCDCPCSCVVTGTLILTPSGEWPVETFRKGDVVSLPLSPAGAGKVEAALASPVRNHPVQKLTTGTTEILTSSNHLFVGKDGKLISAENLTPGSEVLDAQGNAVRLEGNERLPGYTGALHNFILNRGSRSQAKHLYVANGLLSGDLELQNASDRMAFAMKRRLGAIPLIVDGKIVEPSATHSSK